KDLITDVSAPRLGVSGCQLSSAKQKCPTATPKALGMKNKLPTQHLLLGEVCRLSSTGKSCVTPGKSLDLSELAFSSGKLA
ncbi:mCG1028056, partial [Mus musculus]